MVAKLMDQRSVTGRDTLYVFYCPELARRAKPGQFVELKLTDTIEPFLRRPISIFDCDGKETFSLLVRTVGRGTQSMTAFPVGTELDVLGPLGNGFAWEAEDDLCLLVAGGIGLAPLNGLAQTLLDEGKRVRLLFCPSRDKEMLNCLPRSERMEILTAENRAAVPAALKDALNGVSRVFSCGPEGLLETVAQVTLEAGVPCQLSMERHMACGIGICLGCAIPIYTENGLTYKKVCKDGPVFRAEEVSFHELP